MENDNKNKQEPNEEIDWFSRFMFGNKKHRGIYKKAENNAQEWPEHKMHSSIDRRLKDDWIFGFRRNEPARSTHTAQKR